MFLLIFLAGCTPPLGAPRLGPLDGQVIASEGTSSGIQTFTTREREIFRDGTGLMAARPAIVQRGGARAYAVLTNVRRRAPNAPAVRLMATGTQLLPYERHDRLYTHCIDGCQKAEVGAIRLTEDQFIAAAKNGLPLIVEGRMQSYAGSVPAGAFARVLAAAEAQRGSDPPPIAPRGDLVFEGPVPEP
ncbi:hypothetical protein EU805_05915 [Salipiger sp. IMCC34102]|nr:hypothetical protein EU805_05915 [Salipiger sp. IMCC34102]